MDGTGLVSVALKSIGNQIVLEIADNGPGVPEVLRPRLFTPFTTTRADGTGLGLALSQRLVERAGGEISPVGLDRVELLDRQLAGFQRLGRVDVNPGDETGAVGFGETWMRAMAELKNGRQAVGGDTDDGPGGQSV